MGPVADCPAPTPVGADSTREKGLAQQKIFTMVISAGFDVDCIGENIMDLLVKGGPIGSESR
jgi:hypothetical protein